MTIIDLSQATALTNTLFSFVTDNISAVLGVVGIIVGIRMVFKMLTQSWSYFDYDGDGNWREYSGRGPMRGKFK